MSSARSIEQQSRDRGVAMDPAAVTLTCPECESQLAIRETHSGARSISVVWFGGLGAAFPDRVERFDASRAVEVVCPACNASINPSWMHRRVARARLRLRL